MYLFLIFLPSFTYVDMTNKLQHIEKKKVNLVSNIQLSIQIIRYHIIDWLIIESNYLNKYSK